jgi:hypothetical protein
MTSSFFLSWLFVTLLDYHVCSAFPELQAHPSTNAYVFKKPFPKQNINHFSSQIQSPDLMEEFCTKLQSLNFSLCYVAT